MAQAGDLKLLISVEQTVLSSPFPLRITLHLHNAGRQPLWVYAPVRDTALVSGAVNPFTTEDLGQGATTGGPSLEIQLAPADSSTPAEPATGRVLEVAGFPHPKLTELAPGDDYEEKAVLQLSPAKTSQGDSQKALWGPYKMSVVYRARFSNAAEIDRILETRLWEGEVESNRVDLDLRSPGADARASVIGNVMNAASQPLFGMVVTLSDHQNQSISQTTSDGNGKFAFTNLPFGFYWVTARRSGSSEDWSVFRHVSTGPSNPSEQVQLVLLPLEVHRADLLLHKPVLFRVFDSEDKPLGDVELDATWSTGTVSDRVRGRTGMDGTATLDLIPGRNFVTLARKGCPKQDERVEVAAGVGADGFKFAFECSKK